MISVAHLARGAKLFELVAQLGVFIGQHLHVTGPVPQLLQEDSMQQTDISTGAQAGSNNVLVRWCCDGESTGAGQPSKVHVRAEAVGTAVEAEQV